MRNQIDATEKTMSDSSPCPLRSGSRAVTLALFILTTFAACYVQPPQYSGPAPPPPVYSQPAPRPPVYSPPPTPPPAYSQPSPTQHATGTGRWQDSSGSGAANLQAWVTDNGGAPNNARLRVTAFDGGTPNIVDLSLTEQTGSGGETACGTIQPCPVPNCWCCMTYRGSNLKGSCSDGSGDTVYLEFWNVNFR
jgi:hypothetical protein